MSSISWRHSSSKANSSSLLWKRRFECATERSYSVSPGLCVGIFSALKAMMRAAMSAMMRKYNVMDGFGVIGLAVGVLPSHC